MTLVKSWHIDIIPAMTWHKSSYHWQFETKILWRGRLTLHEKILTKLQHNRILKLTEKFIFKIPKCSLLLILIDISLTPAPVLFTSLIPSEGVDWLYTRKSLQSYNIIECNSQRKSSTLKFLSVPCCWFWLTSLWHLLRYYSLHWFIQRQPCVYLCMFPFAHFYTFSDFYHFSLFRV